MSKNMNMAFGPGASLFMTHRSPPHPIVRNSVSQNPYLAAHYAPRGHSLNVDSFQSLRRDMFHDIPPPTGQGSLPSGVPLDDLLSRFHSLESKFALLEIENKMLRGQVVLGGVPPAEDHVMDGSLDDGLMDPNEDGNYARDFSDHTWLFYTYFDRLQRDLGGTWSLSHFHKQLLLRGAVSPRGALPRKNEIAGV